MKTLTGMSSVGGARELAEMLRQMGRGRDTMLAHITPEEAQMLMEMGGSGDINPNTGLPEFQPDDYFGSEFDPYMGMDVTSTAGEPSFEQEAGQFEPGGFYGQTPAPTDMTGFRQEGGFVPQAEMPGGMRFDVSMPSPTERIDITAPFRREPMPITPRTTLPAVPEEPGFAQQAESKLGNIAEITRKYPRLAQLAGYSTQGLIGLLQSARARKQGREEAARFAELGRPLREEAQNLRTQALAGQLTPQQAAAQEAARARARQSAASRGVTTGTQATMIENQLARQRSELSQTNLNNALRQLNLANAYDEAAIKASLSADREADDLLADVFQSIAQQAQGGAAQIGRAQRPQQPQQAPAEITRRPEIPRGQ